MGESWLDPVRVQFVFDKRPPPADIMRTWNPAMPTHFFGSS